MEINKTHAAIAAAGLAFATAFTTGVVINYRAAKKRRLCEPLPGTTKVAKLYILSPTKK